MFRGNEDDCGGGWFDRTGQDRIDQDRTGMDAELDLDQFNHSINQSRTLTGVLSTECRVLGFYVGRCGLM